MIKLAVRTHAAGRVSTARMGSRERAWPSSPPAFGAVQAEVRRRRAARASTGSTSWSSRDRAGARDHRLCRGAGPGARSCARARHRRLGPGRASAACSAPPSGLERAGTTRAANSFPRLTVLDNVDPTTIAAALRRIDPRRVLVNVISKSGGTAETMAQYLVVRAWLEDALGAGRLPPSRLHHRPRAWRAAGDRQPGWDRHARACRPTSAGDSACSRPWDCSPRLSWASTSQRCSRARGRRSSGPRPTTCCGTRPRSTPRSTGPPIPSSAPASTCSCRTPTACGSSPSGTGSSGPRAWASGWIARGARSTAGPRRWRPSAPPTSTARCSSSWKGRSTR